MVAIFALLLFFASAQDANESYALDWLIQVCDNDDWNWQNTANACTDPSFTDGDFAFIVCDSSNHVVQLYEIGECFDGIPTEIGLLTYLNGLALHSNRLTSIPTEIGQLT